MKTKPIVFHADGFEIEAAIVQIHIKDGLPFSRITVTRIREVITDWYESFGLSILSMSEDELMEIDVPDDSPAWDKAHKRAVQLGLVKEAA